MQYSDAHQLFLGNLPHNASENDLRQVFERYGRVAELRVHSKSNDRCKGPQGGNNTARVPNYGFITFEDQQVVAKVLNSLVRSSVKYVDAFHKDEISYNHSDCCCSLYIILTRTGKN